LVCFLYFQFSVCTIPNVTHVYIQNFIQFYIHISDPSKIKRILYTILNIILITSEKPTFSCGLLLDVVTDVKELRYESHVDILYVSLAYQDTILVINGASEKTFQLFYSIHRGYTFKYFCAKSLQLFLSLQFVIFRSFAS
jgi:hypothetical protein